MHQFNFSDITPGWVLPVAVLAVGILGAVGLVLRGRRKTADSDPVDSWERSEERRRRKEAVYGSASYLLLFCCAAVAAALSFHGLVGFGRQNLNLSDGWEYLVPFGLDGAAMFCSVLAVREASHGDAALGSRLLVWTFAGAAAWFNWVHAPRGLDHAGAPQFFAGMSLSAAVLFDRALKQTRRAALREQGLVPRPLPQIRIVRWLRAPRETFGAWSLMLLEGVRTLDEAVEEVREDRRRKEEERRRRKDQERRERARLKALHRRPRSWGRDRSGRRTADALVAPVGPEPAIAAAAADRSPAAATADPQPPARNGETRPALTGAQRPNGAKAGRDALDDELALTAPRLDSLEQKLKDLERQYG